MGYLLLSCCCCSIRQRWQMPKSSWQSVHLLNKHSVIFYVHLWSYIYFVVRCNQWKDRDESDKLRDWFDGTQFLEEYKEWVSSEEYDLSICLVINIDWWQKFKRTVHSLGGIYAAVLNLPRAIRQKLENIFTLGEFRTSLQGLPLAYHITKKSCPHARLQECCHYSHGQAFMLIVEFLWTS